MRHLLSFPVLLSVLNVFPCMATGQTGATTTLTPSPATITVGSSVALAATVQPNNVALSPGHAFTKLSGTITFLDGSTPLDKYAAAAGAKHLCRRYISAGLRDARLLHCPKCSRRTYGRPEWG